MKDALDIHRELLALDVPHEIVRLPRIVLQSDELAECLDLPAQACLSVRLYDTGGDTAGDTASDAAGEIVVGAVVPAGHWPVVTTLVAATGARSLRLTPPERVNEITDFAAGLVSPVLLPDRVRLFADASIREREVVYVATGDAGTALGIRTRDLLRLTGARPVALLAPEPLPVDGSAAR